MKTTIFIMTMLVFLLVGQLGLHSETIALPPENFNEEDAGTQENPYQIGSLANLRWLSETPEVWGDREQKFYFLQTEDIDATETMYWNDGEGFRPIAYIVHFLSDGYVVDGTNQPFFGDYDGGNHKIINLFINPKKESDVQKTVGLFSLLDGANISNIQLEDIQIYSGHEIGAIAGRAQFNSNIKNSSASGRIVGDDTTMKLGGLVGQLYRSNMDSCSSTITIEGDENNPLFGYTGGLIGVLSGSLTNSYFRGNIKRHEVFSGGLVGMIGQSDVQNCYVATKEMLPQSSLPMNVGPDNQVLLRFGSISVGGINPNIKNVFFDRQSTGIRYGFDTPKIKRFWERGTRGFRTWKMKRATTFTRRGWDFQNVWAIDPNVNDGYPYLISN